MNCEVMGFEFGLLRGEMIYGKISLELIIGIPEVIASRLLIPWMIFRNRNVVCVRCMLALLIRCG